MPSQDSSSSGVFEMLNTMRKEFKFFNTLSDDDLLNFLNFCENRQVAAGETLWQEGDTCNYSVFIISGLVGIKKKTEFEGKHMIVGTYGKGSVIGELCLLTDNVRTVTAVAIEAADFLVLTSKNFERLITRHPMLGLNLLKYIFVTATKRLRRSYDRIASIF